MSTPAPSARRPINWPTVLFIVGTSLGALAWPVYAWNYGVTWSEIIMAVVYFYGCGMSITIGYHRLLSHRTFKAHPFAEAMLLVIGSAAWQGSALEWSVDHIQHHSHIDTEADPYNRRRGFWYSHIGWLLRRESGTQMSRIPPFLKNDRLVMFQDRWYVPIAVFVSFVIPFALCGWGGLLLVGAVRIVALHHTTWFINSWAHTGKQRPYDPQVTAADNGFLALFTFGEGWHNYHHAFPNDYRNGVRAFHWDPTKWAIWTMSKLGMAHDLKRVAPATMWRRRVEALLAWDGCPRTRANLLDGTRSSLERLARRSESRIAELASRVHETAAASQADLLELRRRVRERMDGWKRARDRRSLSRARRIEELVEQVMLYRELLERLSAVPAFQAR
ncbi:MAG TPA: fatty acid desaturase [Candidatus Binatia bacterium]|jgi:stearoyl-CoA desaturase (delta-9 desaturase)